MVETIPVKQSVSLAVFNRGTRQDLDGQIILVRRPEGDDDFPGMWGLPAASCLSGEAPEQAAQRAGIQKLGVRVEVGPALAAGKQERSGYTLEMTLYRARLANGEPMLEGTQDNSAGLTFYSDWRWGRPEELKETAERGSLCCQLLLDCG